MITSLFVLGAAVSVALPFYLDSGPPEQEPAPVVRPAWDPGNGPLVQGLTLPGAMPDTLAWSPDGKQLAWTAFDSERNMPVIWLVGVGPAGFTGLQQLEVEPTWMGTPTPSVVTATVEDGLVALRWASGPRARETAGVVDLPGLFGLVDAQTPAVITFGPTTLLAVSARLPEASASPTLHVFDVTSLIQPPAPR